MEVAFTRHKTVDAAAGSRQHVSPGTTLHRFLVRAAVGERQPTDLPLLRSLLSVVVVLQQRWARGRGMESVRMEERPRSSCVRVDGSQIASYRQHTDELTVICAYNFPLSG